VRAIGAWIAGIALAVVAVGVAVAVLSTPPLTRALGARYSMGATVIGLSAEDTIDLVERVRSFVVKGPGEGLPVLVAAQPGFDAAAVSHLEDVRGVLRGARIATVLLAIGVVAWVTAMLRAKERALVARALYVGAGFSVGFVALMVLAAATDFGAFFSAFHGLFFKAGTWTFASDSLLIRLFPEPFWVAAGAWWAGLVLVAAASFWMVGRRLAEPW